MTSDINDYSSKLQEQFKQTSDTTIIRTGVQIANCIGIGQDAIKKKEKSCYQGPVSHLARKEFFSKERQQTNHRAQF